MIERREFIQSVALSRHRSNFEMNDNLQQTGLAVKKTLEPITTPNSGHAIVSTKDLAISKMVSEEDRAAEERFLTQKEDEVSHRYVGLRGYLRLFEVARMIGTLSLYLYLDQYDVHHAQMVKH